MLSDTLKECLILVFPGLQCSEIALKKIDLRHSGLDLSIELDDSVRERIYGVFQIFCFFIVLAKLALLRSLPTVRIVDP